MHIPERKKKNKQVKNEPVEVKDEVEVKSEDNDSEDDTKEVEISTEESQCKSF